jgi:type I restriction enzyme S subunit
MITTKLPTYDKYKPSRVEWLGDIPEHWEVKRLASFGKFSKGGGFSKSDLTQSGVSAILYGDIYTKYNIFIKNSIRFISVDIARKSKEIQKGNLLLTGSGETIEDIGKCVVFLSNEKTVAGGDVIIFEQYQNNSLFLSYVLNTEGVKYEKAKCSKGEIIVHTYGSKLKDIYVPIPPLSEQTAISQFLDHKTALIDQAIDIKQKQIELLKERRQILIHQAVTRGLNPEVKMKDSGVEWIGEVPKHWEVVPIRRLVDVRDGTHDTPLYVEDSIDAFPLVTSKDFEGDLINFENIKKISKRDHINISKRSGVKQGDVLMSMIGGNIGKSVIIDDYDDFSVKNVALFRTFGDLSLAKFLRFYFESGLLQKQIELKSRGGAQGFLSLGDIRNLIFFKVPIVERNKIVEHLEMNVTGKIATAITLKQQEIAKLQEYKATLINSAVTGKIKVGSHAQ